MVNGNKFGSNFNLPQQNQTNEELENSASQEHEAIGKQEGKELSYDHIRQDPKYRVAKLEIRRNKEYSPNALMNILKLRLSQLKEFEAALIDEGFLQKQADNTYWINATELTLGEIERLNNALAQLQSGSLGSSQEVSKIGRQVEDKTVQRPGFDVSQINGGLDLEQPTERLQGVKVESTPSGQVTSSQSEPSEPIGRQQEVETVALEPEKPTEIGLAPDQFEKLEEAHRKIEEAGIRDKFNHYVVEDLKNFALRSPDFLEKEGFDILKELSEENGLFYPAVILQELTSRFVLGLVDDGILEYNSKNGMMQLTMAEQETGVMEIEDGDTAIVEEKDLPEEGTALHTAGTDPYAAAETQQMQGIVDPYGVTGTMPGFTAGGTAQYGEQQDTQQYTVDAEAQEDTIAEGIPTGAELNPAQPEDEEGTFVGTAPDLNTPNNTQENPVFEAEPATPERDLTLDNFEFQKPENIEAYLNLMQELPKEKEDFHVNVRILKEALRNWEVHSNRYGIQWTADLLEDTTLVNRRDSESGISSGITLEDFIENEDHSSSEEFLTTKDYINTIIEGVYPSLYDVQLTKDTIGQFSLKNLNKLKELRAQLDTWGTLEGDAHKSFEEDLTQKLKGLVKNYSFTNLEENLDEVKEYLDTQIEFIDGAFELEEEDVLSADDVAVALRGVEERLARFVELYAVDQEFVREGEGEVDDLEIINLIEDLNIVLASSMHYELDDESQLIVDKILELSQILIYSKNGLSSVLDRLSETFLVSFIDKLDDDSQKKKVDIYYEANRELASYIYFAEFEKYASTYEDEYHDLIQRILEAETITINDETGFRNEIEGLKNRIVGDIYNSLDSEYNKEIVDIQKADYEILRIAYEDLEVVMNENSFLTEEQKDNLSQVQLNAIAVQLENLRDIIGSYDFDQNTKFIEDAIGRFKISMENESFESRISILKRFISEDQIAEFMDGFRTDVLEVMETNKEDEGGYDSNNIDHLMEFNDLLKDKVAELLEEVSTQAVQKVLISWEEGINSVKNEKFRQILLGYIESHFAAHSTEDLKFDSAYSVFEEGTGTTKEKKIGFSLDPNSIEFEQREKYLELFKKDFQGESFEVFLAQETKVFKEYESLESQLRSTVSQIEGLTQSPKYIPRTEAIVRELRGQLRPLTADGTLPDIRRFKGITADMFIKDGLPTDDIRLRTAYLGELEAVVRIMGEKLQDLVDLNREQDNIRRTPEILNRLQAIQNELETKTLTDTQRVKLEIEQENLLNSLRVVAPGEFNKIEMERLQDLFYADLAAMSQDVSAVNADMTEDLVLVNPEEHAELLQSLQLVEADLWNEDPSAYLKLKIGFLDQLKKDKEGQKNDAEAGSPEDVALIHEITQLEHEIDHWKDLQRTVQSNENSREKTHDEIKVSVDSLQSDIVAGSNALKILMGQMIDGSVEDVNGIPIMEVIEHRMTRLRSNYESLRDMIVPRLGYENVQNEGYKHYDRRAKNLVYALKDSVSQLRAEIATTQEDVFESYQDDVKNVVEGIHTMFAEARGIWVQNRVSRIEELNKDLTKSIIEEELKARNLKGIKNPDSAANSLVNGAREWGNASVNILGIKMKQRTALGLGAGCTPVVPMTTAFLGTLLAGPAGAGVGWKLGTMASVGIAAWSGYESFRGQPEKLLDSNRGLEQLKNDYKVEDLFFKLQNSEGGAGDLVAQHPTFDFLRKVEAICVENKRDPETVEEYKVLHKYVQGRLKKFENEARLSAEFSGETLLPQSVVDNYISHGADILARSDEKYLQELDKAAAGSSTKRAAIAAIAIGSVTGVMNLGATLSFATAVQSMIYAGGYSAAVNYNKTKKTKSQLSNNWNVWDVLFNKAQPKSTSQIAAEGAGAAARGTASLIGRAGRGIRDGAGKLISKI